MATATLKFDSRRVYSPTQFGTGLVPPLPETDPFARYSLAFELGVMLGRLDREYAEAPEYYSAIEKDAFLDGLSLGLVECDSVKAATWLEEQERMALEAEWADQGYFDVIDR